MGTTMNRSAWCVLALLMTVAGSAAAPPDTAPVGSKAGSITALLPTAHILRGPAKQETTTAAKKGDDVIWNDLVRTDKGGRARITLLDQSILSVGSQAELRILKHDAKSQQTSIEVGYGRVRMEVTPITKQGGSFEVKTPTAVAGVIGTVFGVDSAIGSTTFLCIDHTLMVGSNDPNIPGRVPCTPGMAAVVGAGKAPVTRPATQQEIQQFVQETEPAVISAMNPSSLLPGTTSDVTITGTQLGNVNAVSSSSTGVTATLNAGGTATSVTVHLVVAATATPGPVTLTLSKPSGVSSAAVFSVLAPPNAAAGTGGDYKSPFLNTIEQERQSAIAGLNGLGVGLAQSADQAYNQISAANSALNPPMDISQAATELKGPVNAEMNAATNDGTSVNQAAQTANTSFTNLYNTAWQALLARNPAGTPDNQFQNDLSNAFNQVNSTLLAAFAASQADLGQQVQAQNASIQQITNNWLAKIQQVAQSQAPPSIKSLSTNAAPTTGGVAVTITGANFDSTSKVMFGNVAASNVTFISPTQLTVIVPPGTPGTVDLTVISGTGLSSTLAAGFNFGGPIAAISQPDITVNPGASFTLDGSRSSDTLPGTTLSYSWTLCSPTFRPPQVGVSLPAMNAPVCTAAAPNLVGTDSQFSAGVPLVSGQYYARLQVTDNLGASAVIFSSVTVSQPSYDPPDVRMNALAQAFSTLQSSQVLAFFDPSYTGLTSLQQSLQTIFPTYSSMTVNLLMVTPNINNTAQPATSQIQANWQLRYTLKPANDPACVGVPNCQPQPYSPPADSTTTVWTLNPSKGWFISEFRLPNGFTQGALPAVPVANTAQPSLSITNVDSPTTPGSPIPVSTGPQSFRATITNVGTAASQSTNVRFTLTDTAGGVLGTSSPVSIGSIAVNSNVQVTATVNVPTTITAVTNAQITANIDPNCNCGTAAKGFSVVITPPTVALPNLVTKIPNVTSGAILAPGQQNIQATVTNSGNAPFAASPQVNLVLIVAGNTIASAQASITGPIPVGQVVPVSAALNIPNNIPPGTQGTLSVDASPGCPNPVEPDCTDNIATVPIIIGTPVIDLALTKSHSGPFMDGTNGVYTLTVRNVGNSPTTGPITLIDTLPAGLGFVSAAGQGWNCLANGQTVTCTNAGPIAGNNGSSTVTLTVSATAAAVPGVTNNATVSTPGDNNTTNNSASDPTVVNAAPAIAVTSSLGNNTNANPAQLNGPLALPATLAALRSDNITNGSVTLSLSQSPVSSIPQQLTSIPYNSPQLVDFAAAIGADGNVAAGPGTVTVTPSQAQPPAGTTPSTLYFNIGDIQLLGFPSCIQVPTLPGGNAAVNLSFNLVSGFNAPNLSWQWSGLGGIATVDNPSGNAVFSGGSYSPALPTFTFTFTTATGGAETFLFAVTVSNAQGGSSATKVFALTFNLTTGPCPAIGRIGRGVIVPGSWSSGAFGGGMARAIAPVRTGALPDLQISANSISFSPSIPKPGDTVAVRFSVTNAGNVDAQHVPVSLIVNGVAVTSETIDLRAGASTLSALEWPNARPPSGPLRVAIAVDPNHTIPQKSTLAKSVPLAHFAFLGGWGQTGTQLTTAIQRATLEVTDGGCVGLRFASGAGSACGSADVEIAVEELASGKYMLSAQIGIADVGTLWGRPNLRAVQYQPEVPAIAGHTYAVQLRGGQTGILRLMAVRNSAQVGAKGRQVFRGPAARNVGGQTTEPVETGDVSGVRSGNHPKVYFDVSYQID